MGECTRGFYWTQEAWYAKTTDDQDITFGMYETDNGTDGEMSMVWEELGDNQVPRLKIYNDAWKVLGSFQDLLQKLAEVDDENITQGQFVGILRECGFEDLTPYKSPYKNAPLLDERNKLQKRIDEIDEELNAD